MALVERRVDEYGIAHVRMLDREGNNLFSDQLINELVETMDVLEQKIRPRVVILSGLPNVFAAGARQDMLMEISEGKLHVKDLLISERLINAPFPIIAAIEGHAIGGGLVMSACCDIVVGALESRYGAVFMNMGFTPGMGCTLLLAELVGSYLANEMMYTGRRFRGSDIARRGTRFNYLIPKNQVMRKSIDVARLISEKNPKSVYLLKYAISAKKKKLLIDARLQEDFMHQISFGYPETKETIAKFYAR